MNFRRLAKRAILTVIYAVFSLAMLTIGILLWDHAEFSHIVEAACFSAFVFLLVAFADLFTN